MESRILVNYLLISWYVNFYISTNYTVSNSHKILDIIVITHVKYKVVVKITFSVLQCSVISDYNKVCNIIIIHFVVITMGQLTEYTNSSFNVLVVVAIIVYILFKLLFLSVLSIYIDYYLVIHNLNKYNYEKTKSVLL